MTMDQLEPDSPESKDEIKPRRVFSDAENRVNAILALNDMAKLYEDPDTFEEKLDSAVQGLLDYGPPDLGENNDFLFEYNAGQDVQDHDPDAEHNQEDEDVQQYLLNLKRNLNADLKRKQREMGRKSILSHLFLISTFICSFFLILNYLIEAHVLISKEKCFLHSNYWCRNPKCGCVGPILDYFWCRKKCTL